MSTWGSVYFQNGASPIMEQLIFFHDYTMLIMIMVMMLVGYILINSCVNKYYNLGLFEGQYLESIWTVVPAVFLMFIVFPSFRMLYMMEESEFYDMTIKVMGYQWYWEYEYSDVEFGMFNSYMTMESTNLFRLLSVDNFLFIPFMISMRVIVTSMDVIHSWTVSSLGVKVDAIPGRLNQLLLLFNRMGMFSGQCSEICGANHSFMPILMFIMPQKVLLNWWNN